LRVDENVTEPASPILLYTARAVRGFGDGFAVIILPVYLAAIDFTAAQIGFVAAAALLGSALMTLAVAVLAPRFGLRDLLVIGGVLMVATGVVLAQSDHIAIILAAAFIGTFNPSSGDIGMLVPLEHAALAESISDHARTRAFARYSLAGAIATAGGALVAATPVLVASIGIGSIEAFRLLFWFYAALAQP
jgi:MFS family permease